MIFRVPLKHLVTEIVCWRWGSWNSLSSLYQQTGFWQTSQLYRRCTLGPWEQIPACKNFLGSSQWPHRVLCKQSALTVQCPQSAEETSRVQDWAERDRQDQEKGVTKDIPKIFTIKPLVLICLLKVKMEKRKHFWARKTASCYFNTYPTLRISTIHKQENQSV